MSAKSTTKSMEKLSEILRSSLSSKLKKADMDSVLKTLSERQTEFLLVPSTSSKKGKRDPNAPKRPQSGYILFCTEERENAKKKHPTLSAKELTSKLGEMWRGLSEAGKKKYAQKAEEDKKRYDAEMENYVPPAGTEIVQKKSKKSSRYGGVKGVLSAYMFFCKAQREVVKKEEPELDNKQITSELGRRWKLLSDSEKAQYVSQAEKDRERFETECQKAGVVLPEKKSRPSKETKPEKTETKVVAPSKKDKVETKTEKTTKTKTASKQTPGFVCFLEENREDVESEHPQWSEKQVMAEVEKRWKALSKSDREDYEAEANLEDDEEEELDE